MRIKQPLLLASFLIAGCSAAFAQAPPTPATPSAQIAPVPPRGATNCTPTETGPRGTITPNGNATTGQSPEPLADKLARSDGVLCPPTGVDSEIHAPTPDTGNTPVIPPPGSPGGDPSVRPK
ncbi:MAG: hypothetical protein JWR89_3054 [Tardiphaga sp.]|uniref:hypothetical protein n=1 Tax=Tardiphaga sp. TaxID=1926292 RepID=UPI002635AC7D|nr:hypothetical protein [Tardiphaga sp.]MDB5503152.1 hypothetical protein [Tardiphaga sp.]